MILCFLWQGMTCPSVSMMQCLSFYGEWIHFFRGGNSVIFIFASIPNGDQLFKKIISVLGANSFRQEQTYAYRIYPAIRRGFCSSRTTSNN